MKKQHKNVISYFFLFFLGNIFFYLINKCIRCNKKISNKEKRYYQLFDNWMLVLEQQEGIEEFFKKRNIKEIGVYGYGNIGRHLITELLTTNIDIRYVIDKRAIITAEGLDKYLPTDNFPEVDAIIITPICEYQEIERQLRKKFSGEVISMEDIIYELL